MPIVEYRLYVNEEPATREQLDLVEEITVEQEVDMAWEARLKIPVCVDEKGNWEGENEEFMQPFSRVRAEVRIGDNSYVPLIDGPVVAHDSNKSSEPGQSSITLVVQDDSAYLNREEKLSCFEDQLDHEIAEQLFDVPQIPVIDIEPTEPRMDSLPTILVQRATAMQMLRQLARDQGMHAYVLPGDEPGQSIGCFKRFSTEPVGLPPLILLGKDRNIETFDLTGDAQSPSRFQAFFLSVTDKAVVDRASDHRTLELLGPEQAFDFAEEDTAIRIAPPGSGSTVDIGRRVAAEAERASYAFRATGSVLGGCYRAVLQPYGVVSVRAANDRLSGDYMIGGVTHALTRSQYSQSFRLMRNALSEGSSNNDPIGAIF